MSVSLCLGNVSSSVRDDQKMTKVDVKIFNDMFVSMTPSEVHDVESPGDDKTAVARE